MTDFYLNYPTDKLVVNKTHSILSNSNSLSFHHSLDCYKESPLINLENLSNKLNISKLCVKDESKRFDLNAFKVLGASYAVFETLKKYPNTSVFCTATDGNHGKAVAWSSRRYGKKTIVYVPNDTSSLRIEAIETFGATVHQLDLNYEQTCNYASKMSKKMNWQLIQDTSWENYEEIPSLIMAGYLTHFIEIDKFLEIKNLSNFDIIFLQCGVGSWAASCIWYHLNKYGKNRPKIVIVEPNESCGVFQSFKDNNRVSPIGSLNTIMAGLNCGIPSKNAWEIIKNGCDAVVKISDEEVKSSMKVFYNPIKNDSKIISGESGAAGLAGLLKTKKASHLQALRDHIKLTDSSKILLFNTEGDTDVNSFQEIIKN
ncbi:MAG: diaminopropionate ammonia-lyase [Cryomorphaceae bacterium BACL29 MAG-121220-bin8]|jgi:diaminopropionate ammonia-lyase|nr:MAG: diaminopropionate ammonia-lyase [Cryomorphaceae bacterium BACL29 MAG-121220-bin8]|tara:strand:- start:44870 stop:45982 length:1113 start_codon:yes stop_codon:yes gene_type:complete